jgi:DNA processing protein
MVEERGYWLAWSRINGVGPTLFQRLLEKFENLENAWQADLKDLRQVEGFGTKLIEKVQQGRSHLNPEQILTQTLSQNHNFWIQTDAEYPQLLLEIPTPPPVLYYRGKPQAEENQGLSPMIAIVGTRHPSEHGRRWTRKIASILAQSGFRIISGLATGIDAEAHQACLREKQRTIAVLGTGVDIAYPHSNRQLMAEIAEKGLILSEYPPGTHPDRRNFPPRNRIIAGLSRAILVMEAPEKSGSLITARYGNEFGRDIYALPNSPDFVQSKGCLKLLKDGSQMIINEGELLEMLGAIPPLDLPEQLSLFNPPEQTSTESAQNQRKFAQKNKEKITLEVNSIPDLSPDLAKILEFIALEPTPFDLIVENSALPASHVSASLLQLELFGMVTQLPGMLYQRL